MPFPVGSPFAILAFLGSLAIGAAPLDANRSLYGDDEITVAEIIMVYRDQFAPPADGEFRGVVEPVIA
ncbi:hypothetical protein FH609_028585 [Streptomyces sp. 3MP-14]|uniref:Uncharacterized protein n=1 Tax=Streptomyces mimosae TaxID=2586635 RepID=A0A5N5ZWY4_9ACTN|nr:MULTISPECIES: hypothetical protein [Streptomyces]KAB8159548.1 hypothetical protein FH607_028065 [Streptomyces mimosae]KAB8172826.1 hypothetical protein FH609_028585 [Streptomyces sp. 3MP-14]